MSPDPTAAHFQLRRSAAVSTAFEPCSDAPGPALDEKRLVAARTASLTLASWPYFVYEETVPDYSWIWARLFEMPAGCDASFLSLGMAAAPAFGLV